MRVRALLAAALIAGCAAPTTVPGYGSAAGPLQLFRAPSDQGQLLVDQGEIFPAAYELVENARHSIQIDIFMFGDKIGRRIADTLIAKKKAGIDVQLVTDPNMGYAGKTLAKIKPVLDHLTANGVEVRFYPTDQLKSAVPWLKVAKPVNHAKVFVADKQVALLGGMNFMDAEAINRDYMMRVTGDRAAALSELVDRDWRVSGAYRPKAEDQGGHWEIGETAIDRQTVPQLWLKELKAAQRSIDIEMLLMDHPDGVDALIDAHQRGVRVRVLLDKTNYGKHSVDFVEKLPLRGAPNLLALRRLVDAGVPVGWYVPRQRWEMLHAKVGVIDGQVALMGSANFTRRAWHGNRELSMRFTDPAVVTRLSREIDRDWQQRREPVTKLTRWQRTLAGIMEQLDRHVIDYDEAERRVNQLTEDDGTF